MVRQASTNHWNSTLYDSELSFISEFGKDVIGLLNPQPNERILDLGCGTGDLTHEIFCKGASAVGVDASSEMIQKAQGKYPHLEFVIQRGEELEFKDPFDAVFSNAALHWMKQAPEVIASIKNILKPRGRFVAELGGKGNIHSIIQSIEKALALKGIPAEDRNPWYFPSIGEYCMLLEAEGFHVEYTWHFDRPSVMTGEEGLKNWLNMFADDFFYDLADNERLEIYDQIEMDLKPALFKDGNWFLDYKRLRIAACLA